MKFSPISSKLLWLVLLALVLAFSVETTEWWDDSAEQRATLLPGRTLLGLGAALLALAVAALLWRQLSVARRAARQSHQLLVSSLDALDVALEIWDAHDCLMLYNE